MLFDYMSDDDMDRTTRAWTGDANSYLGNDSVFLVRSIRQLVETSDDGVGGFASRGG